MPCFKEVNIFTRCRGILFSIILLLCSLYGCYIIMLFLPLLVFDQHRLWRLAVDRGIGFWLLLPVSLMDFLFGTKFCVTGDPISPTEPALIIMNHRTRLDWMHFWSALYRINPWLLTTEKITLKAQLRMLPGAGWAMAANAFVFLDRNLETDCERLAEAIDYYSELNMNYQMLYFPEGTDKSPYTTERSNEYAKKNGLKPYEYLLHPRTTGTTFLLNKMRRTNYIKCVYDVTIAFPENIVQSELQLGLTGVGPKSVHFDIHRIDIADVPKEEEEVANWLNKLWRRKEEKLRAFYEKPVGQRSFIRRGTDIVWPSKDIGKYFAAKIYATCLWMFVLCMWTYHTFTLPFIQCCLLAAFTTYLVIKLVYGGIDQCMFYRWKLYKQRTGQSKLARGLLFVILLFMTTFFGAIFILVPFFPLIFIRPTIWRHYADKMVGYWLTFPPALCEFLFGIKFHITGDPITYGEPALIIMNHRTRLDWLFFWNALYKIDPWLLTTEKISLKAPLKFIPGAGWAMGAGSFLFLNRNWELDKRNVEEMIAYYKDIGQNYQLLLFPEGTDRGERAVGISRAFAEKNNLPHYEYLLHPRTTGFAFLLKQMRQRNYLTYVYDVTVGYPDEIISNELDLIKKGITPGRVHFDIRKIPISDIPQDEEDAAKWLNNVWSGKEKILHEFYSKPQQRREFKPSGDGVKWPIETSGWGRYIAFAFWILTTTMWAVFVYEFFAVKVYTIACIVLYVVLNRRYGGVELFVIEQFKKFQNAQKLKSI